jgi:glycosyltransferase involved in cell wall biosynthesis
MVVEANNCVFSFIKYISPTWYFLHSTKSDKSCFVDYNSLANDEKAVIEFDVNYSSLNSSKLDAAYQALQKGIVATEQNYLKLNNYKPTIDDEYRFIKKYFSKYWAIFILMYRLFELKNLFKECQGYLKCMNVSRVDMYKKYNKNQDILSFNSNIIQEKVHVSIIIPTLNRYKFLADVLTDFEKQTYSYFTIIIIDQSDDFNPSFYGKYNLDIKLIRQDEKALWLARNTGIEQATTKLIAFSEDDVRIPIDWLENHLKCLDYYQCDISNGVFFPEGKDIPIAKKMFKYAEQFATGNACMYKSVFYKTGLFDRQFEKMRAGDGEFGLRCYLNGFKAVSNPLAYCEDVKAATGGLREMGSWDAFRPKKLLAPRPVPSVLYLTRKYFGSKAAWLTILINVPPSILPYKFKRNKYVSLIGVIVSFFMLPIIIFAVCKSWVISSRMLRKGHSIAILTQ